MGHESDSRQACQGRKLSIGHVSRVTGGKLGLKGQEDGDWTSERDWVG